MILSASKRCSVSLCRTQQFQNSSINHSIHHANHNQHISEHTSTSQITETITHMHADINTALIPLEGDSEHSHALFPLCSGSATHERDFRAHNRCWGAMDISMNLRNGLPVIFTCNHACYGFQFFHAFIHSCSVQKMKGWWTTHLFLQFGAATNLLFRWSTRRSDDSVPVRRDVTSFHKLEWSFLSLLVHLSLSPLLQLRFTNRACSSLPLPLQFVAKPPEIVSINNPMVEEEEVINKEEEGCWFFN